MKGTITDALAMRRKLANDNMKAGMTSEQAWRQATFATAAIHDCPVKTLYAAARDLRGAKPPPPKPTLPKREPTRFEVEDKRFGTRIIRRGAR